MRLHLTHSVYIGRDECLILLLYVLRHLSRLGALRDIHCARNQGQIRGRYEEILYNKKIVLIMGLKLDGISQNILSTHEYQRLALRAHIFLSYRIM